MLPDVALAMALSAHGIERSSSSLRERQLQDSNAVRSGFWLKFWGVWEDSYCVAAALRRFYTEGHGLP